jgi:hypothetical protein
MAGIRGKVDPNGSTPRPIGRLLIHGADILQRSFPFPGGRRDDMMRFAPLHALRLCVEMRPLHQ